jgi:hypothetical protein
MAKPLRVQPKHNGTVQEEQLDPRKGVHQVPGGDHGRAEHRDLPHASPPSLLQLVLSGGVLFLIVAGLLVLLLHDPSAAQADPPPVGDGASAPMPSPTPHPVTPTPRPCAVGETYLTTLRILEQGKQWAAAAKTAEDALQHDRVQTDAACAPQRALFTEKALTFHVYALAAHEPSYLNVPVQLQQVKRYQYLKHQARAAGIRFLSSLAVAQRAKENGHWRLARVAYEDAFQEGAFSQADTLLMRQYEEVLFRGGWWLAQASGAAKAEGLRLLATRYALDTAKGEAKGHAWAELRKHCGPDERTWPEPIATPLLAQTP